MMDSLILLAHARLADANTFYNEKPCRNLIFNSEDLFCWYKRKEWSCELWRQLKQLKTMELSDTQVWK